MRRAASAAVAYTQDRATWREQRAGTLTHTGNTFDLGITSDGYFTVSTPRGPRLTRDGRFGLMPNGTLADGAGNAVLDTNGRPIVLSPTDTQIAIAGDGTVSSENGQLGKDRHGAPDRSDEAGGGRQHAVPLRGRRRRRWRRPAWCRARSRIQTSSR